MVANGTRTSSGFKKVHLNMCARALNDHFKTKYSGENVKTHLRTWQQKNSKILKLKNLSAAGWNKDSYMITLDPEHYADYIIVSNLCTCCFHYMICITYLSCYELFYVHAL
jgi:methionine salvage enolase-phosphatase E1